jgi:hypothetical protein
VQVAALRESKKELEECLGRASAAQAVQAAEIKKLSQELQQVGPFHFRKIINRIKMI